MKPRSPWPALYALLIGLFMTLIDVTIVSLANPSIKAALDPGSDSLDNVVWVTSAYLLGLAVPLLVTGRLGDRFGPKRIYLIGIVIFTLGSLTSGLSGTLTMLIVARAVQGIGASLMASIEGEARKRGAARIQLTSNKERTRAHAFYERLGYIASHVGMKKYL